MVERYRSIMKDPARTGYKSNSPKERRRRKFARKVLDAVGVPKQAKRGRTKGSKSTTTIKMRRMLEALKDDNILPHEFFMLVIQKGLRGETLGYNVNSKGKRVPNVITYEQMVYAASKGIQFFAAPIKLEHSGPGGGPLQVFHIPAERLVGLNTEELQFLQTVLPKLGSTIKQIEHDASEGDGEEYAREIGMSSQEEAA